MKLRERISSLLLVFIFCVPLNASSASLFEKVCKQSNASGSVHYITVGGFQFKTCGKRILTNGQWTGYFLRDEQIFSLFREPGLVNNRFELMISAPRGGHLEPTNAKSGVQEYLYDCRNKQAKSIRAVVYDGYLGEGMLLMDMTKNNQSWTYSPEFYGTFCK